MAKQSPEGETRREPGSARPPATMTGGPMRYATLGGVGLLLAVTLFNWVDNAGFQKDVTTKLDALTAGMSQLSGKVEAAAKGAQPPRSGPDPNKVYTVKTQGAPLKGSPAAPIVIAEFSDFQ